MIRGIVLVVLALLAFLITGSLAAWLDEKRIGWLSRVFMLLAILTGGYSVWRILSAVLAFLGPGVGRLILIIMIVTLISAVGLVYLRISMKQKANRARPRSLDD